MRKTKGVLFCICIALFMLSIATLLMSTFFYQRDVENYEVLQPELFSHEPIATVMTKSSLQQIYVCYNDASYVNVYNTSGEFLWAVATPYLRNSYFDISDEHLFIYDSEYAYIYNVENGAFVSKTLVDETKFEFDYDFGYSPADDLSPGDIYFSPYEVYRVEEDGSSTTIVSRPLWYWFFSPTFLGLIAFGAAIGIGVSIFTEITKEYRLVQRAYSQNGEKVTVGNPRARFIQKYFKVTSIVHLGYAVLDILFGIFLDGILCIGIMPLGIHMIASNIVFVNMLERIHLTDEENKIMNYAKAVLIGSFILAFFSVIIAVAFN